MREIRYRAWNKQENRWATHNEQLSDVNVSASVRAPSIMTVGSDKYDLQMFTGLKDKNGVDIYEGDIVHCTHWFFDGNEVEEEFIASVGFKDGSYTLENINSRFYSDYTGEENGAGVCWIGSINYTEEDYEVIGNIYEHPHLLEVSK